MGVPVPVALVFIGLLVSARTRLNAVILGQPVSIPVLWLVAAAVLLALTGCVLLLIRNGARNGWLRLRPVLVVAP